MRACVLEGDVCASSFWEYALTVRDECDEHERTISRLKARREGDYVRYESREAKGQRANSY